jgi:N-acetylneuraminic acid mutarotase
MLRRDFVKLAAAAALPRPLSIEWREGPEYPLGIQDSAFAVLDGKIVSAGGFSRHPKDVARRYPDLFAGEKSGFTGASFVYDPKSPAEGWTRITDIPGPRRQGAAAATVGNALYAIGGFSYTKPWSYRSVYRLTHSAGKWTWDDVHADLPWPLSEMGIAVIGTRIYLVGGADFYAPSADNTDFFITGRDGQPVGNGCLVLDTADLRGGWRRLADLPGVARFDTAIAAAAGKIYALTGVYRERDPQSKITYSNVVDCWVFDPTTNRWTRLADWHDLSNQRAVCYRDRYIILAGSFRYKYTTLPDGTRRNVYSEAEDRMQFKEHFSRNVEAFDTVTKRVIALDPLLDTTSCPMGAIDGDTIYTLGGEGGQRLWHPATFQIGRVRRQA